MAVRPAKITPPRASAAIPRPRLWGRLDLVRKRGGALWISGAPGSGKTTLIASWLAARRIRPVWLRIDAADQDLGTFLHYLAQAVRARCRCRVPSPPLAPGLDPEVVARRLLRALLGRLPRRAVIVLDDAGEIPDGTATQRTLRLLVDELPAGVTLVLAGRGDVPGALVSARAGRTLAVLPAAKLELTFQEAWALARRHGFRGGRTEAERLHRAVAGWAVGLVLLLESAGHAREAIAAPPAALDYFAGEVFERADARTRRVLLEAALLDAPTGSLAARATGDLSAPRILAGMARRGLFTMRHEGEDPAFEFHALFRAFLLARGDEELPPGRAEEVRRAAAHALAERGGPGAEAAFALFADAGAWEEAAAVVARAAPALLAEGRGATLETWLGRFPPELRGGDPWLVYFGAVARLPRDPEQARAALDSAEALFAERGDAAGVWLAWAAAVEATLAAGTGFWPVARRVAGMEALRARFPIPSKEIEARVALATLAGLVHHAPGHPALHAASAAARLIALAPVDDAARLTAGALYHLHAAWWLGDVEGVRPVIEALRERARASGADPVAATFWLVFEAPFHVLDGDDAAAARTAAEARALAERFGVRAWDTVLGTQAIWGALVREDLDAAGAAVAGLQTRVRPGNPCDLALLRAFEAAVALRGGAFRDAARYGAEAKEVGERVGFATVHTFADLVVARAHAEGGALEQAAAALASAREKATAIGSPPLDHLRALAEADLAVRGGRADEARDALARAVPGARAGAVHARYLFSRAELGRLWAFALTAGVAREEVRAIVRCWALPAPPDAGEAWPWPVRIRALGRFEVERDGVRVAGQGASARRPLELLRALVALGGSAVEESVVADALWPDAEADAAHHALETTLYRLRRIVGADALVQRDRRLSLAPGRCWVDAFELDARLASSPFAYGARRASELGTPDADRVAALYRGPLLADADDAPWAVEARDRLRRRLARWLEALPPGAGGAALRARLAAADPVAFRDRALKLG